MTQRSIIRTEEEQTIEPVRKLGPAQQDCTWVDNDGQAWRWTDATGWQHKEPVGWSGSFATVEGSPPYRAAGPA